MYGPPRFWTTFHDMLVDVYTVSVGPEKRAFQIALWLAVFNQARAVLMRVTSAAVEGSPMLTMAYGSIWCMPLPEQVAAQTLLAAKELIRRAAGRVIKCGGISHLWHHWQQSH